MIAFIYTCDGRGKTGQGLIKGVLVSQIKLPPKGWRWCFHGPLQGPHACSVECWEKVKVSADGKLYIDWDHESESGHAPWQQRAQEPIKVPAADVTPTPKPAKVKAPRKHPLRDKVNALETRVAVIEQSMEGA